MTTIAMWYLIFSAGSRQWQIPMNTKEACITAAKNVYADFCINTQTGEVVK